MRCKSSIRVFFFVSKNTSSHTRFHVSILNCIVFSFFLSLLRPHHTLNLTRSQTPIDGQIPSFPSEEKRELRIWGGFGGCYLIPFRRGLLQTPAFLQSCCSHSSKRNITKIRFSVHTKRLQRESQLTRTRRVFSDRDFSRWRKAFARQSRNFSCRSIWRRQSVLPELAFMNLTSMSRLRVPSNKNVNSKHEN